MSDKDAIAKIRAWRREATDDPEGFWGRAAEQLPWFKKWERVLDWQGKGPLGADEGGDRWRVT